MCLKVKKVTVNVRSYLRAVVFIGYGRERGMDFWICRNTGDPQWGEKGYFCIQRNMPNYPDAFSLARRCFYPWKRGFNEPKGM
ncbi:putative zingipain [Helianthus anomalus]